MAPTTDDHGTNIQEVRRQPTMGLLGAINLLLACIIGSGIFISAKAVLEYSGSYGLSIVVWIGCGLLCTLVNLEIEFINKTKLFNSSGRFMLC